MSKKPAPNKKPAVNKPAVNQPAVKRPAANKPAAPAPRKPAAVAATDPGEAAAQKLKARLDGVPRERVTAPRADVRQAASFVLSDTVGRLKDPELTQALRSLPAPYFDYTAVEELEPAAQAALWTQQQLASQEAQLPGARLDVNLVNLATGLKRRMLDVCAYHFRDEPRLASEVEDIRGGAGYLDLAEDLSRLARLYRENHATLKQDLRFYQPGDAASAVTLSGRITTELRKQTPEAARDRAWALLLERYEEVAAACRFLRRKEGGEAEFPSLHAVGRPQRSNTRKKEPAPAPGPDEPHAG